MSYLLNSLFGSNLKLKLTFLHLNAFFLPTYVTVKERARLIALALAFFAFRLRDELH
jgi:hypothetical protein